MAVVRALLVFMALIASAAHAGSEPSGPAWVDPYPDGESKYFAFHKAGVSVDQAHADIGECLTYAAPTQAYVGPPKFVLLGEAPGPRPRIVAPALISGIVGDLIMMAVTSGIENKMSRGNMRRCMGYKGYQRFAISEEAWKAMQKGKNDEVAGRLALMAARGMPAVRSLRP